jgi:hypothetical protein
MELGTTVDAFICLLPTTINHKKSDMAGPNIMCTHARWDHFFLYKSSKPFILGKRGRWYSDFESK